MILDRFKKIKKTELDLIAYNKIDKIKLVKTKTGYRVYDNNKSRVFYYDAFEKNLKSSNRYYTDDIVYYKYKNAICCEKFTDIYYATYTSIIYFNNKLNRATIKKGEERLYIDISTDRMMLSFSSFNNGVTRKVVCCDNKIIIFNELFNEFKIYDTSISGSLSIGFRLTTIPEQIFSTRDEIVSYVEKTLEPSLCHKFKV